MGNPIGTRREGILRDSVQSKREFNRSLPSISDEGYRLFAGDKETSTFRSTRGLILRR